MLRIRTIALCACALWTANLLGACSASFWYTQVQAAQSEKCEKLVNMEDRRRCKAETSIDKERYDKERQRISSRSS